MSATEQFETGFKKGRGRSRKSIDLIAAMYEAAESAQPITGRGIGYKLFTAGLIPDMSTSSMQRVYRLLKEARERGEIPWSWIVDETRSLERIASWSNPAEYAEIVGAQYRRDAWDQQPVRVEVFSEKGTIRGVLQPVLDKYGVGFRVMHGFGSATAVYDIAQQDDDGRELIVLYVGDFDPSGLFMSARDLPQRLEKYEGDHVSLRRIALTRDQVRHLPSFPAADKKRDPRYAWFIKNFGSKCWELDALDPRELRDVVKAAIVSHIEPFAWQRCAAVNKAERESVQSVLEKWAECCTIVTEPPPSDPPESIETWEGHGRDWDLYMLFLMEVQGYDVEGADNNVGWLGARFQSPDEHLGPDGEHWRFWQQIRQPSAEFKSQWADFQKENSRLTDAEIIGRITRLAALRSGDGHA